MLLLVGLLTSCAWGLTTATQRPIIGVLAQEVAVGPSHTNVTSFIAAGYVKAVEASGARVAPIFINRTKEYYSHMMSSVNGVVFPGGSVDFQAPDGFAAAGRIILDIAEQLQDSGVSFPILGVCQGYQLLMFLSANSSSDILTPCNATNMALPLVFKPGFRESSLYQGATTEIIDILSRLPSTSNHHRFCVTESKLKTFKLKKTWRVLSTNQDLEGLEFISSSEHFQRPLVGVQFHPEKNMYEWGAGQANPHTHKAILGARLFYDWLVVESRANNNSFPSYGQEVDSLIYNYAPVYTGKTGYDEQIYVF